MIPFSTKRLRLLLRRDIIENIKPVLFAILTLFGLMLIVFVSDNYPSHHSPETPIYKGDAVYIFLGYYIAGLLLFGLLIFGMAFPDFRNKSKTTTLLTIPATNFEKWLSIFLLTTFGYVILYHIGFYIFNYLAILLTDDYGMLISKERLSMKIDWKTLQVIGSFFLFLHSIYFLGSIIFKRIPVFFSSLILMVIVLIGSLAMTIPNLFESNAALQFSKLAFNLKAIDREHFNLFYFNTFLQLAFPTLLWIASYFKFKEKQIA